jgi:hypothetical protein
MGFEVCFERRICGPLGFFAAAGKPGRRTSPRIRALIVSG